MIAAKKIPVRFDDGIVGEILSSSIPKYFRRIKSEILFQRGEKLNFIYKIEPTLTRHEFNVLNQLASSTEKINWLNDNNFEIIFIKVEDDLFNCNLQMVDGYFPEIMALILHQAFLFMKAKWSELEGCFTSETSLKNGFSIGHFMYKVKIKRFLNMAALGMNGGKVWNGSSERRGIIIDQQNEELLCYLIYNLNRFEDYVFNNTGIDMRDTNKRRFAKIYKNGEEYFLKLNLQVRFF
jgi:type II restriction enzyme